MQRPKDSLSAVLADFEKSAVIWTVCLEALNEIFEVSSKKESSDFISPVVRLAIPLILAFWHMLLMRAVGKNCSTACRSNKFDKNHPRQLAAWTGALTTSWGIDMALVASGVSLPSSYRGYPQAIVELIKPLVGYLSAAAAQSCITRRSGSSADRIADLKVSLLDQNDKSEEQKEVKIRISNDSSISNDAWLVVRDSSNSRQPFKVFALNGLPVESLPFLFKTRGPGSELHVAPRSVSLLDSSSASSLQSSLSSSSASSLSSLLSPSSSLSSASSSSLSSSSSSSSSSSLSS